MMRWLLIGAALAVASSAPALDAARRAEPALVAEVSGPDVLGAGRQLAKKKKSLDLSKAKNLVKSCIEETAIKTPFDCVNKAVKAGLAFVRPINLLRNPSEKKKHKSGCSYAPGKRKKLPNGKMAKTKGKLYFVAEGFDKKDKKVAEDEHAVCGKWRSIQAGPEAKKAGDTLEKGKGNLSCPKKQNLIKNDRECEIAADMHGLYYKDVKVVIKKEEAAKYPPGCSFRAAKLRKAKKLGRKAQKAKAKADRGKSKKELQKEAEEEEKELKNAKGQLVLNNVRVFDKKKESNNEKKGWEAICMKVAPSPPAPPPTPPPAKSAYGTEYDSDSDGGKKKKAKKESAYGSESDSESDSD